MTQGEVLAVFQEALLVAMKISAPLLIASIAIGLVVAIFQAATHCVCVCVCAVLRGQRRHVGFPESGVRKGCELPNGCWELNL